MISKNKRIETSSGQKNLDRMHNTYADGTTKKPAEEDTSKEIIDTHDERNNDEGVDEQFGGDAADNADSRALGGRIDEL